METQLRLITLRLKSWKKLHDLITYGPDKAKPIVSVEQERLFTAAAQHFIPVELESAAKL